MFKDKWELEATLNGGYQGLWGEVVERDMYHMVDLPDIVSINDPTFVHAAGHPKGFNFTPDVIFDLGANIGLFTRYCRSLFPDALIIAVEPNPDNFNVLATYTIDERIILLNKAIGDGDIFRMGGAVNGSAEVYLSHNAGYRKGFFDAKAKENLQSVKLTGLKSYIPEEAKTVLKIDIEGNETAIFCDKKEMDFLRTFDYVTIELHYFAQDGEMLELIREKTDEALNSLSKTHRILFDHPYFYATKI